MMVDFVPEHAVLSFFSFHSMQLVICSNEFKQSNISSYTSNTLKHYITNRNIYQYFNVLSEKDLLVIVKHECKRCSVLSVDHFYIYTVFILSEIL